MGTCNIKTETETILETGETSINWYENTSITNKEDVWVKRLTRKLYLSDPEIADPKHESPIHDMLCGSGILGSGDIISFRDKSGKLYTGTVIALFDQDCSLRQSAQGSIKDPDLKIAIETMNKKLRIWIDVDQVVMINGMF